MASLFTTQVPSFEWSDGVAYELGMKFQSAKAGQITAIRYWKAANETGTHVGKIWSATGTVLATVTFTNETASGWQQQALSTPLNIQANTTYVVTVSCNSYFGVTNKAFASQMINGDLRSVADGNNGVYGNLNSFPINSFQNSNYFRDVVFVAGVSNSNSLTIASGDNQTGAAGTTLQPLVVQVTNATGAAMAGVTVNFALTSGGGSVNPSSMQTDNNGRASTVLTLGITSGTTNTVTATVSNIGSVTFTATTQSQTNSQTIFTTQVPNFEWSDGVAYELGMKFQSAKAGRITAIRYWKAANETGTHVGKIWSATGTVLATVSFANEKASGWQQQALTTPLDIQANTTYIVSVSCNSYFGVTNNALASQIINSDLRSVADGNNGIFGNLNSFPTNSYQNSNYFRDVVFVAGTSTSNTLTIVSGDNQTAAAGATLQPLVVQVTNSAGAAVAGVTVNFAVASGGGSVNPSSVQTDNNGRASTILTLGTTPGTTATVTATGSNIGSVTFTARINPVNTNAIYLENQKSGTLDWKIPQVPQSDIAGFATADSVNKGSSLPIKVSLAQPGNYTIDVYRLGYYQGKGGRLIFSSGNLNGITQPACNFDSSTRTVSCENWSTSYTLQIGSDWTSGLYVAKLTDKRSGSQSQVLFVVRDDSGGSNILFQVSFNTLQAYNLNGGYSLYPEQSIGGQRAFKVSYDRPYAQHSTLAGGNPYNNIILAWEYKMLRWLESQGYDVSYITNVDVHARPQILQQHKVFLSVGHDEYWSLEAFNRLLSSSIHQCYFSGNSVYWRVRFENSRTGVANRIMACYKDTSDPVAPTNKFRSPQNNKPESLLKGNMYIGGRWQNFFFDGFDYVVKNSSHPYYANTNLKDGDKLIGLVGFEWDAINLNASPSGLVTLSESIQPQNFDEAQLEGFPSGTNPRLSQAVAFTSASGAKVFSAGSVQFAWGLDSDGVSGPREDIRVKQMVVNILADMGAKPALADPGIIVP
ncbi:DUF4082 domain-containing protein [Nostoc sp. FACHB-152]|uniref:N,N-dimethylformamidase beta subunit family domain-containing protein n=1 Tax=unclassified Nostoc TaxID=2593658 RepID=UPI0016824019|nr:MULTISPECIES: N,N-dimethylformamidase beta subunit family domain-containing protein [unclassified Nostoc]MBD2451074.1 DUF4082 domain-containing protein [Nostoc sp. FACHB-152]MBD2472578.1 DUF4082 domain-containing protein [Nostoc sp. FACHB-145]